MKSIRRGLRDGEVEKNPNGRFACRVCGRSLRARDGETVRDGGDRGTVSDGGDRGTVSDGGTIRACPDCGRQWKSV